MPYSLEFYDITLALYSSLHEKLFELKSKLLNIFVKKYEHLPEQGSDEWKQSRIYTAGGSEIAAIIGKNPYSNRLDIIAQKTNIREFNGNRATRMGNLMEPINQHFIEQVFDTEVKETGSLPGCVPYQKYSPDGLAVAYLMCERNLSNGLKIQTRLPQIILLEFKSPLTSIPNGEIPKHYLPQIKTGLSSIPIVDIGIFMNSMFRICSLDDLGINKNYNKKFHSYDESKMVYIHNPLAIGTITVWITKEKKKEMTDLYNSIYDDGVESDSLDSEDEGPEYLQTSKIAGSTIEEYIIDEEMIDFGEKYKLMDKFLELYSEKELIVKYENLYINKKELNRVPFIAAQQPQVKKQKKFKYRQRKKKGLWQIGVLPWKLFNTDLIPVERDEAWPDIIAKPIAETMNAIKSLTKSKNIEKEYIRRYPDSKIAKSKKEEIKIDCSSILDDMDF